MSGQQRAYLFPWQPISLNNGGVPTKNMHISAATNPRILNMVPN